MQDQKPPYEQLLKKVHELEKTEERYRLALENILDVIVIYDKDLRIKHINNATLKLSGRPVTDFIGKREQEIWPPEIYQTYLPVLEGALAKKQVGSVVVELPIGEGNYSILNIRCVPILNEFGEVIEIIGVTHDLTDSIRGQRAAQNMEQRFKKTLEQINLIAVILDIRGNITFANPYLLKITGYTLCKVIGENWFSVFIPDSDTEVQQIFTRAIQKGKVDPFYENTILCKNGDALLIRFHNSVLYDGEGNIIGSRSIGEDITERRNAEEAIRHSEERFSDGKFIDVRNIS